MRFKHRGAETGKGSQCIRDGSLGIRCLAITKSLRLPPCLADDPVVGLRGLQERGQNKAA